MVAPSRRCTGLRAGLLMLLALALSAVPALARSGWQPTGSMAVAHRAHGAVLLRDGRVLVASGFSGSGEVPVAELYDPTSGSWSLAAPPLVPRHYATATRLNDGRVLLAGGRTAAGVTNHAELYDPIADTWTATGAMNDVRNGHAAVLLPDGRVLVAGGADGARVGRAAGEVYDPATGTWTPTANAMTNGSENLHAALLADGRVLVAGGFDLSGVSTFYASADVYDPATNGWAPTGSLTTPRGQGGTALLPDGRVLAAGGVNRLGFVRSIELYDPAVGSWSPGGEMPHVGNLATATALGDGRVLIQVDGSRETVLFEPATDLLSPQRHESSTARTLNSTTVLRDGRVLMAGGNSLSSAELFTPPTERSATAPGFGELRVGASAERDVSVENSGGNRLWIDGTALAGAAAGDYAIVADACSGAELLPAETCTVRVRFTPSASGARSAELTFDDNAETSPALALDGAGSAPDPERPQPPAPPVDGGPSTPQPPAPPAPPVPVPAVRPPAIVSFALAARCVRPVPAGARVRVGLDLRMTRKARVKIEIARALGTRGRTVCPARGGSFDGRLAKPRTLAREATRMATVATVRQRHTLTLRLRPALYRITVRPYVGNGRLGRPAHRWLRVLAP